MLEYSEAALTEAAAGYRRIEKFVLRASSLISDAIPDIAVPVGEVLPEFAEKMNEDLAVPQALAIIHDAIRRGNKALEKAEAGDAEAKVETIRIASEVRAMTAVLGVDPLSDAWLESTLTTRGGSNSAMSALDVLVQAELERRSTARADKDWAVADEVRDRLAAAGVEITDTADGAKWSLKG